MNRRIHNFFVLAASVSAVLLLSTCLNLDGSDDGEIPAVVGPAHAAASVSFTDIDLGTGEIAGTLTITKASDESDITHYLLYWGGSATAKLSGSDALIEEFPKSAALTRSFPPDTAIPSGATHLVVITKNASGEMASGVGCSADVKGTTYSGSEGTAASPVFLAADLFGKEYAKQIGKGKSYYYTTALGTYLSLYLEALTDDVDIVYYGTDSSFTTPVSGNPGPDYGRLQDEYLYDGSTTDTLSYYFVLDGGDTGYKLNASGASFKLVIESSSGGKVTGGGVDEGSQSAPVLLRAGVVEDAMVGALGSPLGESYYKVPAVAGKSYLVNATSGPTVQLYSDQFVTAVSEPATAVGNYLYIKVSSTGSDAVISLEVVGPEGTADSPVYLKTVKTNFCMVNNASSYFSFDVNKGQSYTVTASDFSTGSFSTHNVDLFVFPSGSFSGAPTSSATSSDPESVTVTAQASTLLVRVDDKTGDGGVFLLKAQ